MDVSVCAHITLHWDEEVPHVIHYRFDRGWTWDEFRATALREHELGHALGERYDIIGDLTDASLPMGTSISNVLRLFDKGPENRKLIVVTGSLLAQRLISAAGKVYPRVQGRFLAASSIAQARQIIGERRAEQQSVTRVQPPHEPT